MTDNKEQLLQELNSLGYTQSGRKKRSDAGKTHVSSRQSKLSIYCRVRARLYNQDYCQKSEDDNSFGKYIEMDTNSFYLLIPERYSTTPVIYKQIVNGREIVHNVARHLVQKAIDLEKYRFDAYYEQAMLHSDEPVPDKYWADIRQMLSIRYIFTSDEIERALINRQITWFELFCEFYFLQPNEASLWSDYSKWKEYYANIPTQKLDESFVFQYGNPPGSPEFHPEWAYKAAKNQNQKIEEDEGAQRKRASIYINNLNRRRK